MRTIRSLSLLAVSFASLVFLTCTGQENPFKPSDATVTPELENSAGQSGTTISDSVGKPVKIILLAYLPSYIDSVKVIVANTTTADTDTVRVFNKGTVWTDTQIVNIIFRTAGTRTVTIIVFAGGTEKTSTVSIDIAAKPVPNHRPALVVTGLLNITTAQTCSLSLSVRDSDTGQTHLFTLVKGPKGATFTDSIFRWTPPAGFTGTDSAVFSVTDNGAPPLSDTATEYITVSESLSLQITAPLPAATNVAQGGSTALTVAVSGTAPISYQWYYNGAAIGGATGNSYSKTWGASDGGYYKIVVSNAKGKDSSTTQVTVCPRITAGLGPSTSIAINSATALSVTAAGTPPMSYQWYRNDTAISGATTGSYSKTWAASDGGVYKVIVSNGAGSDSSETAVTINSSITTPLPGITGVKQGSSFALSVVATGTPPITYQWYYNNVVIIGATSASYSKTWGAGDGGIYKIVVTNGIGKDSSSTQLIVAPVITSTLGATTNMSQGGNTALSVSATGTAPLSYQWYLNDVSISGATLSAYSKTWGATDGGVYKVIVGNAAGSDSSHTTLNVGVVISPRLGAKTSFNQGSSGQLSVTATGTAPITYQWYFNGNQISGAASSSYSKTWQYADSGTYKVMATNAAGTDTSSTVVAVKDVTPPVIILKGSLDTTIAIGSTWTEPGDSAWDDRDGVITNKIKVTGGPVAVSASGKFTLAYNVSDTAGNAATVKMRTVRVVGWELVNNTGITINSYDGFAMKLVNNNLYIAYVDNSDIKTYVKKLNGNSWDLVGGGAVDALEANMVSLAVSSDGTTPYIGYVSTQTNKATIVSRLQGGTWQTIFTSQYDYTWSNFADVEISPTGGIYLVNDLSNNSNPVITSLMKYNTVSGQMVPTDTLSGGIYRNYYQTEKDYHVLAFASDGTPYITYRGPGGFTIKKKPGTSWIGAGATAADSIFDVAYSAPLQTVFSNNNLFVLVSSDGANPTVYNLKAGSWTNLGTITSSGSVQPCLAALGDTCYVSYASYPDYTGGPVYVKKIVNGSLKNVPEVSPDGLAIAGTFNYSWVEVGNGIVYAAGRDQSSGVISLMKYVKQ
ncbi:MAG TPA: immunoglobulin domain-containing protein [Chitinivibrionales bacterium]|nr:immunoglobulin domain-containing protein [Chitinivibrionales bacterium]